MGKTQASAMKTLFELWKKRPAKLDLKNAKIPWNLEGIKAPEVWRKEKAFGRGVTVAVIDSGILPTPSLAHALWKNSKESFNGKDDDENGLIDDVFGYDFISGVGFVGETNRMMSHGSACAGIIAGRTSPKSKWLTGVAPEAELMLLKGSFDLRVLEYLLDQGADLVSMSFMIVGRELGHLRGLYRNAFEHLSAAGVLSMGGAGNYGAGPRAQPVGKQIGLPKDIPCVVAVAGVNKDLSPISFSSKGPCFWENVAFFSDYPRKKPLSKPDLTAFPTGYPMWTHPPNRLTKARGWREISAEDGASLVVGPGGNSFSGPHGVGVAALVWSVNPEMNPWEVHALLEETAVDLGPKGRDFRTGAGLLDALAAVKAARK
jgi:subtilisin family serine protease